MKKVFILVLFFVVLISCDNPPVQPKDPHQFAIETYDIFLLEYGDKMVSMNIQCSADNIFLDKNYFVRSNKYVEYYCDNGKAMVYEFDRGPSGLIMLPRWDPESKIKK